MSVAYAPSFQDAADVDLHQPAFGLRGSVYLWDAAHNPLGTHKHLIAGAVVERARGDGWPGLAVGSCGQYGVAIAANAAQHDLRAAVVIPEVYSDHAAIEAAHHGAQVIRYGRTYEDAVDHSRRLADELGYADGNVDGLYRRAALDALGPAFGDVLRRLPVQPWRIHVPLGNGTTIASIGRAMRRLGVAAALTGVTSRGNNSVAASFRDGTQRRLDPTTLRETAVNEPLCNWNALHGREALAEIAASGGTVVEVTDAELEEASRLLREECGISSRAPGAAGLLSAMHDAERVRSVELVVLTLSGR